jgi:energy-coupling factor transport system ATP-binding protein
MTFESDAITLESVCFTYPSNEETSSVVENINLSIRRGEWLAIAGTNGSGKSTLAKLITRLFTPTAGTVRHAIDAKPSIQLIFQNPDMQIIGDTVYDDVIFGMENYELDPGEMPARAAAALGRVGLKDMADTPVSRLSGGQKQLLCIASALAVQPAVFVFDEATSMLDPLSRSSIVAVAQQLHREGKTVIWITQCLDELAYAERVVALDKGGIVFEGTPRQFFYGFGQAGGIAAADERAAATSSSSHLPSDESRMSCCERLSFVPPYTVRTARILMEQGFELNPLPLSPAELGKAVSAL